MQIAALTEKLEDLGEPSLAGGDPKALAALAVRGDKVSPAGGDASSGTRPTERVALNFQKMMVGAPALEPPSTSATLSALFSQKGSSTPNLGGGLLSDLIRSIGSVPHVSTADIYSGRMNLVGLLGVQQTVAYQSLTIDFVSKIVGKLLSAVDTLMKQG